MTNRPYTRFDYSSYLPRPHNLDPLASLAELFAKVYLTHNPHMRATESKLKRHTPTHPNVLTSISTSHDRHSSTRL